MTSAPSSIQITLCQSRWYFIYKAQAARPRTAAAIPPNSAPFTGAAAVEEAWAEDAECDAEREEAAEEAAEDATEESDEAMEERAEELPTVRG